MLKGFREFIMKGNLVDLAVAFVLGLAFAGVVEGLVKGLINPIVAAIFGKPDLTGVGTFTIGKGEFSVGTFLDPLVNFIIVAAAVYFFVVVPVNKMMARFQKPAEEVAAGPTEVELLTEIRDSLRTRG